MKKTKVIALIASLPVFALAGGLVHYAMENRRIGSELNAFVERSAAATMVPVQFVVSVPAGTPKGQIVYLSGSVPALGNWDAAGVPLERSDDGKWRTTVEVSSGIEYGYKLTRGTWGTVETDPAGAAMPDRTLKAAGPAKVDISVADWIDHGQAVPGRVTTTGDIRLHKNFRSKLLGNQRTLAVCLPPGYEQNPTERYAALYMQDGQNLFDESTSFAGIEWKMDEAAQGLIGGQEVGAFIIVGVYNTPDRTAEYTPPGLAVDGKSSDGAPARGDLYARFLAEELKPWIDQTYRTQSDRAHTLVGGAALGGTIALHTARSHPEVYGDVLALSPRLRQGERRLMTGWSGDGQWLRGRRIYADMGTTPGDNGANYPGGAAAALADGKEFAAALQSAGLERDKDFVYAEVPAARHDERSYQGEIQPALKWLFAK